MIPIRDTIRSYRTPFIVYALVAANAAAYIYEVQIQLAADHPADFLVWLHKWALVPREVVRYGGAEEYVTFFTSMFLHGGLLHLLGNMLYLWIFGDNVEDRCGHVPFLFFYVFCGLAAAGAQFALDPMGAYPMLGASGAVAGVLGAYIVLFPGARVVTLIPVFFFAYFVELPAFVFLGIWLVFQNVVPATIASRMPEGGPGIAYWAHIGGFVAGAAIALLLRDRLRARYPIGRR